MDKYKDVLLELKNILGDFYITGSYSLKEHGLKRVANDLDLIITNSEAYKKILETFDVEEFKDYIDDESNSNNIDSNGFPFSERIVKPYIIKPVHLQITLYSIKIDIFYYANTVIEYKVNSDGYKIADKKYSIDAKKNILKKIDKKDILSHKDIMKYNKHRNDLNELDNFLYIK